MLLTHNQREKGECLCVIQISSRTLFQESLVVFNEAATRLLQPQTLHSNNFFFFFSFSKNYYYIFLKLQNIVPLDNKRKKVNCYYFEIIIIIVTSNINPRLRV